jgi:hypothetical protein
MQYSGVIVILMALMLALILQLTIILTVMMILLMCVIMIFLMRAIPEDGIILRQLDALILVKLLETATATGMKDVTAQAALPHQLLVLQHSVMGMVYLSVISATGMSNALQQVGQ